jgi:protein NrfD
MTRSSEVARMQSPAALFGRHRERMAVDPRPYSGPTYYGRPAPKPGPWSWEIAAYIFIAGVAGSAQVIATAADLFGGRRARSIVRHGRYLALAGAIAGPPLLIADLKTPQRWYNMLRIFRRTSPMSIGSYILTSFGATSALTAAAQLFADRGGSGTVRRAARIAQIPAALAGAGMSTYTGALLSATSTPLWSAEPGLLGARFACSSVATGAAALSLAEHARGAPENTRALDKVAMVAAGIELALSLVAQRRYRDKGLEEPIHGPEWETPYRLGAVALGAVLPLACYGLGLGSRRRSPGLSIAASLAVLAGGAILRQAVLHGGKDTTRRPQAYFSQTQGRRRLARTETR